MKKFVRFVFGAVFALLIIVGIYAVFILVWMPFRTVAGVSKLVYLCAELALQKMEALAIRMARWVDGAGPP